MLSSVRGKRITVYAQSGRISERTLLKIVREHINSNNAIFAEKALKEYQAAVEQDYSIKCKDIQNLATQIQKLKNKLSPKF